MNILNIFKKEHPLVSSEPIIIGQEDINPFEVDTPTTKKYKYTIKKQEPFILKGKIHGSVGICIEPIFDKEYFELTCKGHSKPDCACGGDDFIKTFVFTPCKKGRSQIVIKHGFRGSIVKTEVFDLHIV